MKSIGVDRDKAYWGLTVRRSVDDWGLTVMSLRMKRKVLFQTRGDPRRTWRWLERHNVDRQGNLLLRQQGGDGYRDGRW